MENEETQGDAAASRAISETNRLSRRQALGRMSVVATAGAAAWVVPEILTAKAAGGATLSAPAVVTSASSEAAPVSDPAATSSNPLATLAFTGLNIQRDAEVGAALIAGGWAMHHWASRAPTSAPPPEDSGAPA
jgi:hypothetical protein